MYAARHFREQAQECFRLARETSDPWVSRALDSLGFEMLDTADEIEPRSQPGPLRASIATTALRNIAPE
jgi:hypothetical protein